MSSSGVSGTVAVDVCVIQEGISVGRIALVHQGNVGVETNLGPVGPVDGTDYTVRNYVRRPLEGGELRSVHCVEGGVCRGSGATRHTGDLLGLSAGVSSHNAEVLKRLGVNGYVS